MFFKNNLVTEYFIYKKCKKIIILKKKLNQYANLSKLKAFGLFLSIYIDPFIMNKREVFSNIKLSNVYFVFTGNFFKQLSNG